MANTSKIYNNDGNNMVVASGGKLSVEAAGGLEIASDFVKGQRFQVTFPNIAAADVAKAFFIAPAACKLLSAYEVHGTVCDAADTLQIEKCTSGEDAGAGDELLAAAFTLNSTKDTPVTKAAVTTAAASLAAGDCLMLKFKTGDGTNYAEGCVTCTMEWL
jgi:hypothetical protein